MTRSSPKPKVVDAHPQRPDRSRLLKLVEQFGTDGYVVLERAIPESLLDQFWNSVEENIKTNPKLKFSNYGQVLTGAELRKRSGSDEVTLNIKQNYSLRIVDIESHAPLAAEVFLHSAVSGFLEALYGIAPTAIQTLTYKYSSQQGAHSDLYLVNPPSVGKRYARDTLVASWIACESADEENGALIVYPGSQRLSKPRLQDDCAGDYPKYVSALEEVCAKAGIKPRTFFAQKGDVLFWHGDLIHAGGRIRNADRTRKSLVAHYARVEPTAASSSPKLRRVEHPGGWYFVAAQAV